MGSNRFQWNKSELLNYCQQSTTWVSNQCSQAKTWVSKQIDSEPVLRARGAVNGAVNAALGVHYYFDLGMAVIPATSPWYNTMKGVKYTATTVAFIVATYQAYDKNKKHKNTREKLIDLEEKLIQIDKMLNETQLIFDKADKFLCEAGYSLSTSPKPTLEISEIKDTKPETSNTTLKSKVCDLLDSKPAQYTRAILDGAVKASGVHYIFDLGSQVIPKTKAYTAVKDVLIGATFLSSTLSGYGLNKSEFIAHEKLNLLKQKIGESLEKLKLIQKKLGSREELIKIIKEGSKVTKQDLPIETKEIESHIQQEENKSAFSKLMESKPAKYVRAGINGAVNASGIHYIFENGLSELPSVKYIASGATLFFASIKSYDKNKTNTADQEELKNLDEEIEATRNTLLMAKKIMKLQEDFIRMMQSSKEQKESTIIPAEFDDEDNEILLSSLNEISLPTGLDSKEIELKELPFKTTNENILKPESALKTYSIFKPVNSDNQTEPLLDKDNIGKKQFYNSM